MEKIEKDFVWSEVYTGFINSGLDKHLRSEISSFLYSTTNRNTVRPINNTIKTTMHSVHEVFLIKLKKQHKNG